MKIRFATRLVALLAAVLLFGGCATSGPEPLKPEAPGPLIQVDGDTLPSIQFFKVRTDIPGGRRLGSHYEGIEDRRVNNYTWDKSFENVTTVLNDRAAGILKEAGYRIDPGEDGDIHMKGRMRRVTYNSFERKISFTQAEMEVRWQLFRPGEDDPFAVFSTQGEGRVDNIDSGAMVLAFELALRRLLADPEFPKALQDMD